MKKKIPINLIVIIASIIFISITAYIFFNPSKVERLNVTNATGTQETFYIGSGAGRALIYFATSSQRLANAKKYGVYIISADRKRSTSRTTCLRYNYSTRTPCYYYKCPSSFLGYDFYKMSYDGSYKCSYIKYPRSYFYY